MLGQRRRRWPNIKPALGKCLMFAGYTPSTIVPMLGQRIRPPVPDLPCKDKQLYCLKVSSYCCLFLHRSAGLPTFMRKKQNNQIIPIIYSMWAVSRPIRTVGYLSRPSLDLHYSTTVRRYLTMNVWGRLLNQSV